MVPEPPAGNRVLKLNVHVGVFFSAHFLHQEFSTFHGHQSPSYLLSASHKRDWPLNENLWGVRLLRAYFAKQRTQNKGPGTNFQETRAQHWLRTR